jgi:hypothetical protein
MAINPLQKYFRQPKVYISLPSKGVYYSAGNLQGNIEQIPVYGMTGMDEIMARTPDALLSGESTIKIVESCCPTIKNAWEIVTIDLETILTAIRIATYGNLYGVETKCLQCGEEHAYDIDLNQFIDHYKNCTYENKVVLKDYTINLRPITYKETSEFSIKNFEIQQKFKQVNQMPEGDEKKLISDQLFKDIVQLQKEIFSAGIESVEAGSQTVNERSYINEWLDNCEKSVFDHIKRQLNTINKEWTPPATKVKCTACGHEQEVSVTLDQSDFFV